ncbi:uncharacterized protein LOC132243806 [Alligator mississippiensis]|uniref:uncharacterized protein LOC132243806 n=1 Tax=Alligator mississippiensis TaxID=8496 RepID=UPI00287779AB|nr:uncharacterized protein LOC132243806 [Alligator mississippiensis]
MCEAVSGNLPGIRDKYHALLSKQTVNRESIVWKDQQVRMRLFCTMQHQLTGPNVGCPVRCVPMSELVPGHRVSSLVALRRSLLLDEDEARGFVLAVTQVNASIVCCVWSWGLSAAVCRREVLKCLLLTVLQILCQVHFRVCHRAQWRAPRAPVRCPFHPTSSAFTSCAWDLKETYPKDEILVAVKSMQVLTLSSMRPRFQDADSTQEASIWTILDL